MTLNCFDNEKIQSKKKKMHEVQHDRLEWENYLHKKMPSLFPSVNILTQISPIIQRGSRSRAVQVYTLTSQKYSNCALVGTHFPVFKESLAFVSATINFSRVFFILEGKKILLLQLVLRNLDKFQII